MIVTTKASVEVEARREDVWAALHDADRIALCVPGSREVKRREDGSYAVEASVRFGPVRVAFDGVVEIGDHDFPARLTLTGRGQGGLAGAASGTATITLTERPGGCRCSYELQAETDGPIARLGPVFLTGLATTLAGLFTRRFARSFGVSEPDVRTPRRRSRTLSPRPVS